MDWTEWESIRIRNLWVTSPTLSLNCSQAVGLFLSMLQYYMSSCICVCSSLRRTWGRTYQPKPCTLSSHHIRRSSDHSRRRGRNLLSAYVADFVIQLSNRPSRVTCGHTVGCCRRLTRKPVSCSLSQRNRALFRIFEKKKEMRTTKNVQILGPFCFIFFCLV